MSNSASSHSFVPLTPATTSRAHFTYSSRRLTDHSGDGLAVIARRLLVLSASLMSLARLDFFGAVLICFRFLSSFGSDLSSVPSGVLHVGDNQYPSDPDAINPLRYQRCDADDPVEDQLRILFACGRRRGVGDGFEGPRQARNQGGTASEQGREIGSSSTILIPPEPRRHLGSC